MKKALLFIGLIGLTGLTLLTGCGQSCGFSEDTGEFVLCDDGGTLEENFGGDDSVVNSDYGTVYSDGQGFTGATFGDGTGVTCGPDGGCIY